MPIMFYAAYNDIERAHAGAQVSPGAKSTGMYRIYKRLDGRFEIRHHTKQPTPQQWELVSACELNPVTGDWIELL